MVMRSPCRWRRPRPRGRQLSWIHCVRVLFQSVCVLLLQDLLQSCSPPLWTQAVVPNKAPSLSLSLCDFVSVEFVVTYSSTGPRKRFREMIAAHGGGHGRSLPGLDPIRNSCELRGLCCRSYFGPRTCVRGITNIPKCARLSIRVSPSHPYNAGRAGLGWGGVGWS